MLKVFTDFNARTADDICWNLNYLGKGLSEQASNLCLKRGDKIILYQDENDFEVIGILDFRYVPILARETWIAVPDWPTLIRKPA
jgi:hypothetical protein